MQINSLSYITAMMFTVCKSKILGVCVCVNVCSGYIQKQD